MYGSQGFYVIVFEGYFQSENLKDGLCLGYLRQAGLHSFSEAGQNASDRTPKHEYQPDPYIIHTNDRVFDLLINSDSSEKSKE